MIRSPVKAAKGPPDAGSHGTPAAKSLWSISTDPALNVRRSSQFFEEFTGLLETLVVYSCPCGDAFG